MSNKIDEIIESGIKPLELIYKNIISVEFETPFAFYCDLIINSVDLGVLYSKDYLHVASRNNICIDLFLWQLKELCKAISLLKEKNFEWILIYTPIKILKQSKKNKSIDKINQIINEYNLELSKICLMFPEEILFEDYDEIKENFQNIKNMGFKTAISDFGSEFCPVSRLSYFKFDVIFTDEYISFNLQNENETNAKYIIKIAKQSGADVILYGDNNLINKAYSLDCKGVFNKKSDEMIKLIN